MTRRQRRDPLDDFLQSLEPPETAPAPVRPPPRAPEPHPSYAPDPPPRAPSGGCRLCARPARHRCVSCGTPTCSEHHWALMGLCHLCADEDEMRQGRRSGKYGLGIKWVE